MNAIVSGRSGRALIIEGEVLKSVEIDDPSSFVPRKRSDLPYLFGDSRDLHFVKNTTTESVVNLLTAECNLTLALDLTLISLDAELESDIRREALEGLEELFEDNNTLERVERVMYSHPVPDDGDLDGALEICPSELETVSGFLSKLEAHQATITEVDEAWEAIPTTSFNGHENRKAFRRVAVEEGLFHALATTESAGSISTFLLKANLNPSIKQLPNYRQIIQAWVAPFRESRETPKIIPEEDYETFSDTEKFGRRGARLDRRAVLREAQRRKSVIVDAMRRRDLTRVEHLVNELIAFHQSYSESQHTAKSLCDLAMEAKAFDMYPLQLALTERSINIAPGDSWSWIQHADALLKMQRLDEALQASDEAIAFGGGVVAKNGRAEILKAQGQFAAALTAYEEVIRIHPESAVAKNGRAEVLKAQGQFTAALAAYDEVIRIHPENVVAKNGRAEVLKAQGQFAAALTAYEEVMRIHPEDVVAKNGRAEVLKIQGQFATALTAYEEVIRIHPEDVVAKNGRAEILKIQGQFAAALTAYEEVIRIHPENVVAKTGRAEVLKAQGQFAAALTAYEEVIRIHRESVVAKAGRAEVLKAQGKFAAALTAYEEVIRIHPENVVAKAGRAEVLKAQGQFAAALTAYEEVIRIHPENVVAKTGRAEVLKAQGQFAAALTAYEEVIRIHPEDVVAKNGRAEVLKAQGQFAAALSAFDIAIDEHPQNSFARIGRSSVLLALRRYQEAMDSLPKNAPLSIDDWIAYHIRGMILLRLGRRREAIKIFDEGLRNSPFPSTKEYFQGGLALSWLQGRDFRKAGEALEAVTSPILQPTANVIRIHAFGAQGQTQRALQAYQDLASTPHVQNDELTQELHHQYVLGEKPTKDDEWIFDQEVRIYLRAA